MKIQYLGTAAAEGAPALFCNCDKCVVLRKEGGKNLRSRTQAVIDGKILVDCNPDTYMNFLRFGLNLTDIKHVLITHSHSDHLYELDLAMRDSGKFHHEKEMFIYGNSAVINQFKTAKINLESCKINLVELKFFEPIEFDGYRVTPIPAEHMTTEDSFVFVIEKDGKSILYCNDTGLLSNETVAFLTNNGYKFDFIGFDCTYGTTPAFTYGGHMSLYDDKVMYDRFLEKGIVSNATKVVVTHFAHWYLPPHEQMQKLADEFNFTVAYDGIEIDI